MTDRYLWDSFVIGLPESYRGEPLEASLHSAGITFHRSPGVIVPPEFSHLTDRTAAHVLLRRDLHRSEIGCALAHRDVYRRMLDQGLDFALVLEDDARLSGLTPETLERFIAHTDPAMPTVALLYAPQGSVVVADDRPTSGFLRAVVPPTTTTAYIVSRRAASILLGDDAPVSHVADWPVAASATCQFWVAESNLVLPADGESTIGDRATVSSSTARILRRLAAVTHLRWFAHRRVYGSYGNYASHELLRGPLYRSATRSGVRNWMPPVGVRVLARVLMGPRSRRLRRVDHD